MKNLYKAIESKYNATLTDVEDGILVQYNDSLGNLNWHVLENTKLAVKWLSIKNK